MKIIITLLLLLMPIVAISADRILKVGKNYVEVTPSKVMTDINGNPVEVWYENNAETYGQDRIDKELIDTQKDLTDAQALDGATYKQEQIDKAQVEISRLQKIQAEMDKKL